MASMALGDATIVNRTTSLSHVMAIHYTRCLLALLVSLICIGKDMSFCTAMSLSRPVLPPPLPHSTETLQSDGFWNGPSPLSLPDPPSSKRLALIRASPYRGGFEPAVDNIEPYDPKIVNGAIPRDLVGSLATNGPGRIRIRDRQYGHWFDGDGYVTLLQFYSDGTATFCARYVRTDRFQQQEDLMAKLPDDQSSSDDKPPLAFSGAWTLGGRGHWYENMVRIPANPANTATLWLPSSSNGPRLFALCEGGHPIELDPITLEKIAPEKPFESEDGTKAGSFFSAHFSKCPTSGEIFNHGYILNPLSRVKQLNLMKLSNDGILLQQRATPLPFDTFVHDATLSQNYLVYVLPPYHLPSDEMYKFILGMSPIGNLSKWDPKTKDAFVHVHSRTNLELKWSIKLPKPVSLYHLVDAYDEPQADGTVLLQVRAAQHIPNDRVLLEQQFRDQYRVEDGTRLYTTLYEYTYRLGPNGSVCSIQDSPVCQDCAPCEFPTVNTAWKPKERRRYCWVNALSSPSIYYLDGVQKIDMNKGTASRVVTFGRESFGGAPAFIPSEDATSEDDGYLVITVYRSLDHRSDVVILDAKTLDQLCVMELRNHVPYQFHGEFLPGRH